MSEQTIVVVDSDPKNLQILKENLEAAHFRVLTATNGEEAWELVKQNSPTIILSEVSLPGMDGFELLERLQQTPETASIPLLFLTNRRDVQDRVRSLKMGAKDYLVKPLHVKEVIAHIRMVLNRLERRRTNGMENYFTISGRLDELNLFDLIESFGVERKTGILTLHNDHNKSGQVFFRDGCVINAVSGDFVREQAIFQMLPWTKGQFQMVFKEVDAIDEIAVSNLGLLLQGLKRMEQREKYLQELPSPETTFVATTTFKKLLAKKKVTPDLAKFVSLFDGQRTVLEIIDDSCYDDLKTLERIVRLYHQGFIKPSRPVPAAEEVEYPPKVLTPIKEEPRPLVPEKPPVIEVEEVAEIEEKKIEEEKIISVPEKAVVSPPKKEVFRPIKEKKGLIVIIGYESTSKEEFLKVATDENLQTKNLTELGLGQIAFGRLSYDDVDVLSISIEKQFTRLLDQMMKTLSGYLVMVDYSKPESWEYSGYVIRSLEEKYQLPHAIVILNVGKTEPVSLDVVRDRLSIHQKAPLIVCDPIDKSSVERVFIKVLERQTEEQPPIKIKPKALESIEI
ncbi:MAG: response regulator [candidate division KSB1 bacterium]|nr:response regulator [candidate division KSB1 bacterium]